MTRGAKAGMIVAAVIITFAVAIMLLTFQAATGATERANAAQAVQFCASFQPRFMAYDKGTGTNNFGPPVTQRQLDQVENELKKTLCTDASIAYDIDFFNHHAANATINDVQRGKDIARLASDATARSVLAQKVYNEILAGSPKMTSSNASYQSMAHIKGNAGDIPTLRKASVGSVHSTLLTYRIGSSVKDLRLECRFQPFAPNLGVPSVGVPPAPGTPKHTPQCTDVTCGGGNTPGCTTAPCGHTPPPGCKVMNCTPPPKTCPPSMPHGTWPVCKDDGSAGAGTKGNVPPQGTGTAPPAPAAPKPPAQSPKPHTNPPPPAPAPQPTHREDPAPPPATGAPAPTDPGTTAPCAPGIPTC